MRKQGRASSTPLLIYGIITLILLFFGNLAQVPFTLWLTAEQIGTGFGYGTNMEILALVPWTIEIICSPILIVAAVYFLLHILKKSQRTLLITNVALTSVMALQYALTNLFIWF